MTTYTIGEMARRTRIPASTLRFYDKNGLLPFLQRTEGNIRLFTDDDLEPLYTIQCLKSSGMPLKDIRRFMELFSRGNETISERRIIFEAHRESLRAQIRELNEMLQVVDYKCRFFAEAERLGDIDFYKKIPPEELPEEIAEFLDQVHAFGSDGE